MLVDILLHIWEGERLFDGKSDALLAQLLHMCVSICLSSLKKGLSDFRENDAVHLCVIVLGPRRTSFAFRGLTFTLPFTLAGKTLFSNVSVALFIFHDTEKAKKSVTKN